MDGFKEFLRSMGNAKIALMAAVAVAMIGGFAMVAMRISSPGLAPLYSNLSPEDGVKITTELGKLGVPYESQANGAIIMVPNERVLKLRMTMAQAGLPSNGSIVGYEIFDKTDNFGSSNFVMNLNMVRALEGELSRTIASFRQIESARVHLVMPKRELFAKDREDPSASVAIKLRGGLELSRQEVASITHFVAAAVPGLKPSKITVVDSFGRLLARGDGEESVGAVATAAEEYRQQYENRMRETVENLLERVVGPGNVKVQLSADINFDRVVTDTEKFDPEGQVARSVQSTSEREDNQEQDAKDAVTVANQTPAGQSAGGGAASKKAAEKTDETTNYEISKTVQKHIKEGGNVNRLSVAVLVDGIYTGDDKDKDKKTYTPRSDEEIQRLTSVVKSAIGFDEKRGDSVEVVSMQFTRFAEQQEKVSLLDTIKQDLQGIIQTLIIAGVTVLAILVVLRPAMQHIMKNAGVARARMAATSAAAGLGIEGIPLPRLPGQTAGGGGGGGEEGGGGFVPEEEDAMVNIQNIKGRIRSSSLKKVTEVVERSPEEALNVMRQWILKEAS